MNTKSDLQDKLLKLEKENKQMREDNEKIYNDFQAIQELNKMLVSREEYEIALQENEILNTRLMEAEERLAESMDKLSRFDEVFSVFFL